MARKDLPISNRQVVQTRLHLPRSFVFMERLNISSMSSCGSLDHEHESMERKKKLKSQLKIWLQYDWLVSVALKLTSENLRNGIGG